MPRRALERARERRRRAARTAAARASRREERERAHERSRSPSGSKNGRSAHAGRLEPTVDADLEARVLLGQVGRQPGEADRPARAAALRRALVTRPAGRPARTTWRLRRGSAALLHLEADEQLPRSALLHVLERPLPDEVVLVEP